MEIMHLYNSLLLAESQLYRVKHDGALGILVSQFCARVAKLRAELESHPDRLDCENERAYLRRQVLQHLRRTAASKGACNTCAHYQWNILVRNAGTEESLDCVAEQWLNMPGEKVVCDKTGLLRDQPLMELCLEYAPDKAGMIGNAHHGVVIESGRVKEVESWRALYDKYRG
jgi:hypothetical protein